MTTDLCWTAYLAAGFHLPSAPGLILDIGCGRGDSLHDLSGRDRSVIGVDADISVLAECRDAGFRALAAKAEQLPIRRNIADGLLCKVVLPYTDEALAIDELARVLKPGASVAFSCHGAGYYLRYLLAGPTWRARLYAARSIINSWYYIIMGRRLPGWIGDTLYQSRRRLLTYCENAGLVVAAIYEGVGYLRLPTFIYCIATKSQDSSEVRPPI